MRTVSMPITVHPVTATPLTASAEYAGDHGGNNQDCRDVHRGVQVQCGEPQ
jgi:hypothetical protein